jgi:acyl-CoA reductase-like NAD-dependent aldehyde dehydrogenase
LDDVDPCAIAERIFWAAFENSGQVCAAIKRLFVHEKVFNTLLSELRDIASRVRTGDGLEEGTDLGPINNLPQFERVCSLVEDARRVGGKVAAGGNRVHDRGYFFAPTLITDLPDDARLVVEEQFGPVLPVLPYRDIPQAVERANSTHFGLSGSVWGGDKKRAASIAGELDCGTVWVNQHLAVVPNAPIGGHKWSGIGVENGPWGLLGFTEIQTLEIPKA